MVDRRPRSGPKSADARQDVRTTSRDRRALRFPVRAARRTVAAREISSPTSQAVGDPEENKQNIHFHYDLSEHVLCALVRFGDGLQPAAIITSRAADRRRGQRNKFDYICRKLQRSPASGCSISAAAGAGYLLRRAELRRHRSRRDAGPKSKSSGRAGRVAKLRAFRPGHGRAHRLHRRARAKAPQDLADRDVRARQHRQLSNFLPDDTSVAGSPRAATCIRQPRALPSGTDSFKKKRPELKAVTRDLWPGGGVRTTSHDNDQSEAFRSLPRCTTWRTGACTGRADVQHWHDRLDDVREAAAHESRGAHGSNFPDVVRGLLSIVLERSEAFLFQTLASKRGRASRA